MTAVDGGGALPQLGVAEESRVRWAYAQPCAGRRGTQIRHGSACQVLSFRSRLSPLTSFFSLSVAN